MYFTLKKEPIVYFCKCFFYFQIIVERAPRSRAPELDKKKYLVPSDLTGDFTQA